jgi:hypothetical protein
MNKTALSIKGLKVRYGAIETVKDFDAYTVGWVEYTDLVNFNFVDINEYNILQLKSHCRCGFVFVFWSHCRYEARVRSIISYLSGHS